MGKAQVEAIMGSAAGTRQARATGPMRTIMRA